MMGKLTNTGTMPGDRGENSGGSGIAEAERKLISVGRSQLC